MAVGKVKHPSVSGKNTRYLGHFRKEKFLCAGHNTEGDFPDTYERLEGVKGEVLSDTDARPIKRLRNRMSNIRADRAVIKEKIPGPYDEEFVKKTFSEVKGLVI